MSDTSEWSDREKRLRRSYGHGSDRPDSGERGEIEKAYGMIQDVFRFLNRYGEDPYNMGRDPRSQSSISPHAIIADTYARLAPLYHLLAELADRPSSTEEGERDEVSKAWNEGYRRGVIHGHSGWKTPDDLDRPDPSTSSEEDEVEDEAWDWPISKVKAVMHGLFERLEKNRPAIRARTVHALASTWCMNCGETFDVCECEPDAAPTETKHPQAEELARISDHDLAEMLRMVGDLSGGHAVITEAVRRLRTTRTEERGNRRVIVQHIIEEAMNEGERQSRGVRNPIPPSHYTDRILAALDEEGHGG